MHKFISFLMTASSLLPITGFSQQTDRWKIVGRWDITIESPTEKYPSWLEVRRSGVETLVGYFVGRWGSLRPISQINFDSGVVRFRLPPQWEDFKTDLMFEGTLTSDQLDGWTTDPAGNPISWVAHRAPALRRTRAARWEAPISLFNGSNLDGWHCLGPNQWQAKEGVLSNAASGGNLVTDRSFGDFKLHVEFRYPKMGNSGIYLRGRYEVQILDSRGLEPASDNLGAIYGLLPPSDDLADAPEKWQSFDITLVGRMVTVVLNGTTVICNREIPGITGGALDSEEHRPGPLLLQGDHGPVEFRNIILTPANSD